MTAAAPTPPDGMASDRARSDRIVRPDPTMLFRRRAERLDALAVGHPMAGFLDFVARICRLQDRLAVTAIGLSRPDLTAALARDLIESGPLPPAALAAQRRLLALGAADMRTLGEEWLAGRCRLDDLGVLPTVVAALQIERTLTAITAQAGETGPGRCPLCGGPPFAATLDRDGDTERVRHLHCALCGTAWRLERLRCAGCGQEGGVVHRHGENDPRPVRAECCRSCGGWLKLFDRGGDAGLDPLADDLATIDLDFALADTEARRLWPNPFLHGAGI